MKKKRNCDMPIGNLKRIKDFLPLQKDLSCPQKSSREASFLSSEIEGWRETFEIMSDKKAVARIKKAKNEIAQGHFKTIEEVFGRKQKKR